ncbi:MAG: DUF445 family protein [Proteobacteria bacterium]|nr:DUF445 family protein [Pseudomonadota bacterium]MBU1714438.1 DUF445 family protein [Pseudomonadota bacterium]
MTNPLTFLAPPLVGAFIGYMTNYVAIRMLFRPLKPWRLFGIRVPMTPGVIPGKRHELAINIGEMVGEHLLTSKDIKKALGRESFNLELKELINGRVTDILHKDLGPIASLVPKEFTNYFKAGIKILRWRSLKHLHNFINSEAFAEKLSVTISARLQNFMAQETGALLPEETAARLFDFLEKTTTNFLAGPAVEQWLTIYTEKKINEFIKSDQTLSDLIPQSLTETLLDRLQTETPRLIEKFAALLQEPEMRDKITHGICQAISHFIAAMGPMAAFIGNFINPETIEQKIRQYLQEKGDDVADGLFDQATQTKITAIIRQKVESLLHTPASTLLKNLGSEKVEQTAKWLSSSIVALIKDPKTSAALINLLREALAGWQKRTIEETLTPLFGQKALHDGQAKITSEVVEVIRSPMVKRLIDQLAKELLEEKIMVQPIGQLSSFLPHKVQDKIDEYLLQFIKDLLIREVPGLVDSLNIKEVVTQKVDSLDLLRLEGLLLGIMQEQFKYINLFGALLGFIIGLLNLIVLFGPGF